MEPPCQGRQILGSPSFCNHPHRSASPQCGAWFGAARGSQRACAPWYGPWGADSVLVPSPSALEWVDGTKCRQNEKRRESGSTQLIRPANVDSSASLASGRLAGSHLERLPTEFLEQILQLLIPTGTVMHVFPTHQGRRQHLFAVHYISPGEHGIGFGDTTRGLQTLPLVYQRLKDMTYEVFYGRNQFVFEIAARPLTSRVELSRLNAGFSDTLHQFSARSKDITRTWCRVVERGAFTPLALAPLGPAAVSRMRNMALVINIPSSEGKRTDWHHLTIRLSDFARAVAASDPSCQSRRKLMIHVTVAGQGAHRGPHLSDCLMVTGEECLTVGFRFCDDDDPGAPELANECREEIEEMLRPLRMLSGWGTVEMSGLVHENFAAELQRQAMATAG